jgi:hypothetical protein
MALDPRYRLSPSSSRRSRGGAALGVALAAVCPTAVRIARWCVASLGAVGWGMVGWGAPGCGAAGDEGPDPAALRADRLVLDAVLSRDGSRGVLREVDEAVEDRLPVRAAEMLRGAAVPAVRRLRVAIEAETLRTEAGRAMRARAVEVLEARAQAMERYADALARGEVEDERLLAALHAHRLAEQRWLRLLDDAHALDVTKAGLVGKGGSRLGTSGGAASSREVPALRSGGSP